MKKLLDLYRRHRQFLLYAAIGGTGVILDIIIFFVLFNSVGLEKNLSTFISLSAAITNNFILNTLFNFKLRDKLVNRFVKFYLVGLSGFFVTALLFLIMTDWLRINANVTKLVSLLPILVLQYSINKLWSFKNYEKI